MGYISINDKHDEVDRNGYMYHVIFVMKYSKSFVGLQSGIIGQYILVIHCIYNTA